MRIRWCHLLLLPLIAGLLVAAAGIPVAGHQLPPPTAVDFVRDVQPILRQRCYGCHGSTQQMNGFRLDRRSDALRGGTLAGQ